MIDEIVLGDIKRVKNDIKTADSFVDKDILLLIFPQAWLRILIIF